VARLGLWLVAAVLAVRQVAVVLSTPQGDRLTDLETWVGPNGVLHVKGSLYDSTQFTGTPFGGLVLKPLTRAAEQALGWGWTFGTLLLVVALGLVVARALPQPVTRRSSLLAAPVAISLLMLSLPVRNTLWLGQTSIIPVLLVLLGCFTVRGERAGGVLIGLAAALQPTVLLFAPLLWFTGRRRAAVTSALTFAASVVIAWAAMPHDSYTYWVHHIAGAGLGGAADGLGNQSLHGALLRLGLTGPLEIGVFLVLGAAVAYLGLRRAVRYARDGQLLLAVAVTGCAAIAVSPTTWQHQLLWVLLAVVGRVGKRTSDRYVWPVAVVLVVTLPAKMMLPNMAAVYPLRDNVVLLMALAAATVVPFLSRTSEYYRRPIPTEYAEPVPTRWKHVPLLPFLRRVLTRPNLLLELLLIRVTYAAYQQVRLAATGGTNAGGRATAEHHGREILSIERFLHIDIEHAVNHWVVKVDFLKDFFNFYYESFHFVVPLTVMAVLYWRRPVDYRWARSALGFATLLALVGFWLYPPAPRPRHHRHGPRRPGLLQAGLRHPHRPHQPVRGDALAALRLVPVVRCRHLRPGPQVVDEGPGPAAPLLHRLRDRRDRQPLGPGRGRRRGGRRRGLRPGVRLPGAAGPVAAPTGADQRGVGAGGRQVAARLPVAEGLTLGPATFTTFVNWSATTAG
jgi:hypothetical protein